MMNFFRYSTKKGVLNHYLQLGRFTNSSILVSKLLISPGKKQHISAQPLMLQFMIGVILILLVILF